MDAVLPLIPRDLERYAMLARSFERFVTGLDTLWAVVPPNEVETLRNALANIPAPYHVEVRSELALIPELRLFPKLGGWYRQQLVKLEAANLVQSDFFLTLDGDIIATRPVDLNALVADGRASCHVTHADLHPRWYKGAAAVLGIPLARPKISHQVTPTILHREGLWALHQHLDARWNLRQRSPGWRGIKQRAGAVWAKLRAEPRDRAWRLLLANARPWTEYSLYYSFLELNGRFNDFHEETSWCLYDPDASVWHVDDFERWDPAPLFKGEGPPFFSVIQSNTGIPASTVRDRLGAWL